MGEPDRSTERVECADGRRRMAPLSFAFRRGVQSAALRLQRWDCPYDDLLTAFGRGPWLVRAVHAFKRAWREGWEHETKRRRLERDGR